MSLDAAAAPSLKLICGFLAPSRRARAKVPIDLEKKDENYNSTIVSLPISQTLPLQGIVPPCSQTSCLVPTFSPLTENSPYHH